jgi:hypothetical protein
MKIQFIIFFIKIIKNINLYIYFLLESFNPICELFMTIAQIIIANFLERQLIFSKSRLVKDSRSLEFYISKFIKNIEIFYNSYLIYFYNIFKNKNI